MHAMGHHQRQQLSRLPRAELRALQLEQLRKMLAAALPQNAFYSRKLAAQTLPPRSLDELANWPFTTKQELADLPASNDRSTAVLPARLAANRTYSLDYYVRCHRTSGTRGEPLVVLDTAEDWQWWLDGWQFVLDAAHVDRHDRVLLAFSFGPFVGFWTAFDAVAARGAMTIPTGGMTTLARLDLVRSLRATVVLCTPSYALHLAATAQREGIDLPSCGVRCLIVAGEPGGSLPAVRGRIAATWGAQVIDHAGATEVGPWGFGDSSGTGLYVNESQFLAEWLVPGGDLPAAPGQLAELVITTLGRSGAPVIRYRTGDLARPNPLDRDATGFVFLPGGIRGRADDMCTVRGVNIFPSALDEIVWADPHVQEYRATVRRAAQLDTLEVDVESTASSLEPLATQLQVRLGLRVDVRPVPLGSLPRFEGKARRFQDQRHDS